MTSKAFEMARKRVPAKAAIARMIVAGLVLMLPAGCVTFAPPTQIERMPKSVPVAAEFVGKTRWALALSGGSARGFAHIGVLRVLEEAGLKPDLIVGTSAGAIIGSLYASGLSVQEVEAAVRAMGYSLFNDVVLPSLVVLPGENGLIRGEKMMRFIDERLMTRHIEDFPIRFAAVATDMKSGDAIAFNSGHAALAVRASASVPGVFTPVDINGRLFGDGQIVSPMPVVTARQLGASRVIAVDVVYPPEQALLSSACAQMAHFYDLTGGTSSGISDAKMPDAQAGAEKGYNHALVGNAGANLIYESAGMHGSLLGFSLEGVVLDNDIVGAAQRTIKGIEVSDETLSVDVIRAAVIGGPGHYLGSPQTLELMQTEYIYPAIGDRLSHKEWAEVGRPKIIDRAIDKVRDTLASHFPSHIPEEVDALIRSELRIGLDRSRMVPPQPAL